MGRRGRHSGQRRSATDGSKSVARVELHEHTMRVLVSVVEYLMHKACHPTRRVNAILALAYGRLELSGTVV
eukprot:2291236-Amphidinium_carterae.2